MSLLTAGTFGILQDAEKSLSGTNLLDTTRFLDGQQGLFHWCREQKFTVESQWLTMPLLIRQIKGPGLMEISKGQPLAVTENEGRGFVNDLQNMLRAAVLR